MSSFYYLFVLGIAFYFLPLLEFFGLVDFAFTGFVLVVFGFLSFISVFLFFLVSIRGLVDSAVILRMLESGWLISDDSKSEPSERSKGHSL